MGLLSILFPPKILPDGAVAAFLVKKPDGTPILITENADSADALVANNPDCTVSQIAYKPLSKELIRQVVYKEI